MSKTFKWVLAWLFGASLAFLVSVSFLGIALSSENNWVPTDQDGFYHARRILDTAKNPNQFYEFDYKIHAPEGSLLTWPWGYDYLMGRLVQGINKLVTVEDPFQILAYIPPVWLYINSAFLIGILFALGLPIEYGLLGLICFALIPANVNLHKPGNVDHHFIELSFVFLTYFFGLINFKKPGNWLNSLGLGMVLGIAPGFQSGLFVLQIPILLFFTFQWQQRSLTAQQARIVGLGILAGTLFMLVFAEAFWLKEFSFYVFSWFHAYIAFLSLAVLFYFSFIPFSIRNFTFLSITCLLAITPILNQLMFGTEFILSKVPGLHGTAEMTPGWKTISDTTGLLYLAPIFLGIFTFIAYKQKKDYLRFAAMFMLFGLFLLSSQIRFIYYGITALFIPLFFCVYYATSHAKMVDKIVLKTGLYILLIYCFFPFVKDVSRLIMPAHVDEAGVIERKTPILGGDLSYEYLLPIMSTIVDHCSKDPGILLADPHFGNQLRYHTDCLFIANRMLITPQHFSKAARVAELLQGSIEDFLKAPEPVKYVLISLRGKWEIDPKTSKPKLSIFQSSAEKNLSNVLLYDDEKEWGEHFELISQSLINLENTKPITWVRFFKVKRN
ncbi:MAG: Oligosaccharyl transferase [Francisellaceae bacterium]|nr:Oligosaccharyl transferase [Francisellaceae bacterium]